jgi:hypothetical protein
MRITATTHRLFETVHQVGRGGDGAVADAGTAFTGQADDYDHHTTAAAVLWDRLVQEVRFGLFGLLVVLVRVFGAGHYYIVILWSGIIFFSPPPQRPPGRTVDGNVLIHSSSSSRSTLIPPLLLLLLAHHSSPPLPNRMTTCATPSPTARALRMMTTIVPPPPRRRRRCDTLIEIWPTNWMTSWPVNYPIVVSIKSISFIFVVLRSLLIIGHCRVGGMTRCGVKTHERLSLPNQHDRFGSCTSMPRGNNCVGTRVRKRTDNRSDVYCTVTIPIDPILPVCYIPCYNYQWTTKTIQ